MINREPRGNAAQPINIVNQPATTDVQDPAAVAARVRDRVHWGAVWAGFLTAITLVVVIDMFLYWLGALSSSGGSSAGWISAIVAIVAFFFGGWVATASTTARTQGTGMLNGFLVWALGIVLILAFSGLGLGTAFGALGNAFTQVVLSGRSPAVPTVTPSQAAQVVSSLRDAAGWGFLFLIVSAAAAAYGGYFADRNTPAGGAPHATA